MKTQRQESLSMLTQIVTVSRDRWKAMAVI